MIQSFDNKIKILFIDALLVVKTSTERERKRERKKRNEYSKTTIYFPNKRILAMLAEGNMIILNHVFVIRTTK